MGSNDVWIEFWLRSISIDQKYQFSVRQSIWEQMHLKSWHTPKKVWQYIAFVIPDS